MPKYRVQLSKKAAKQLDKLPDGIAFGLIASMEALSDDPRPSGCKKLKGRNAYRVRKGDYRIIYEILDSVLVIDVIAVGHRRDIYD